MFYFINNEGILFCSTKFPIDLTGMKQLTEEEYNTILEEIKVEIEDGGAPKEV